jgi:hypothetical protein
MLCPALSGKLVALATSCVNIVAKATIFFEPKGARKTLLPVRNCSMEYHDARVAFAAPEPKQQ